VIIYADTNIIISFFDVTDPLREKLHRIFSQPNMDFVTGAITVLEFEAIMARQWFAGQFQFDTQVETEIKALTAPTQVYALTELCFRKISVRIIPASGTETFWLNSVEYKMDGTITMSLKLCPHIRLRTLDMIQIASALKIKTYESIDIQYLLTQDQTILQRGNEINKYTQILPISCQELYSLLKLSP